MRSWKNQLSSTVFKKAGQKQSQTDRLRSAFRLIQARKKTFPNNYSFVLLNQPCLLKNAYISFKKKME
ncbi:hypothetical protein E4M16_04255 [Ligilactobacillus ruminis]|nr:hypothetical protein E4M16_04255 [Ligilactobacillus ruminis]